MDNFQRPFHRHGLEQSIHPVCPLVSWMSPTTMVIGQIAFKLSKCQVTWDIQKCAVSNGILVVLSLQEYRHRPGFLYLALGFQSTICLNPEPELDMHGISRYYDCHVKKLWVVMDIEIRG